MNQPTQYDLSVAAQIFGMTPDTSPPSSSSTPSEAADASPTPTPETPTAASPASDDFIRQSSEESVVPASQEVTSQEATKSPSPEVTAPAAIAEPPTPGKSALPEEQPTGAQSEVSLDNLQVRLKVKDGRLMLILPPESETASKVALTWNEIWQQFKQLLSARERFGKPNTPVHLLASDRLLDSRQLQAIADALSEAQLQLKWVHSSRRQTAVVAATAGYSVEQMSATSPLLANPDGSQAMEEPLYIQMTLRSGTEIRHNGTVIVMGDLNPGGTIIAEGDILVWGRLRGVAHAGCKGNVKCLIMALQLEPTQIRIADLVARAPEKPPAQLYPEVAYVSLQGNIRIARATDFSRREEGLGNRE